MNRLDCDVGSSPSLGPLQQKGSKTVLYEDELETSMPALLNNRTDAFATLTLSPIQISPDRKFENIKSTFAQERDDISDAKS